MALQMNDPFAIDSRELCILNRSELGAPGMEIGEVVAAPAHMNVDELVPAGAIGAVPFGFGHGDTLCLSGRLESRCRATADGGGFPSRTWRAVRSWAFSAPLRGSTRLANPSAPPSVRPKTRTRCSAPSGGPGTTVPKKFSNG